MISDIQCDIKELEDYIGFPIKRKEIMLESNEPHDETFSYGLCQRFYRKDEELKIAIKKTTDIIMKLISQNNKYNSWKKEIALFFSLLGDMYYIASDFNRSINCFMKSLSYNKNDITNWIGLMFSLRAYGKINIFEDIIFNFDKVYNTWKKGSSGEMNQEKIYELMRKIKKIKDTTPQIKIKKEIMHSWSCRELKVYYYPKLEGYGTILARPFVKFVKEFLPSRKQYTKVFEWCSGPGFIGFALLAEGICQKLCLADINPLAIECVKKTVIENNLQDSVSYYVSDNFKTIPEEEHFDMVVANPPNYFAINPKHYAWRQFKGDLRPNDAGWKIHREFYNNVSKYLNPEAFLFISEVEPFKKEVFIPISHPIPYDIRQNLPIDDFKKMILDGNLIYIDTKHYFTSKDAGTKMWMVISKNKKNKKIK